MLERDIPGPLQDRIWYFAKVLFLTLLLVIETCSGRAAIGSRNESNSSDAVKGSRLPLLFPLEYREFNLSSATGSEDFEGRFMLGNARTSLYGHVTGGYYFVQIQLGTPPQTFALIVDTGSTVTYVPCASCRHCGKHQDKSFVPENSHTYVPIKCADLRCNDIGFCDQEEKLCKYDRHYAEKSSSTGTLGMDVINFGSSSEIGNPLITFGCETDEQGLLYKQKADGIIGLGRGPLSVPDQLSAAKVIDDSFSLCYGGMFDNPQHGGALIMGSTGDLDGTVWMELDPDQAIGQYYNVKVEGISVHGKALDINNMFFERGFGTILDSGTTFTYLPGEIFDPFVEAVQENIAPTLTRVDGPDKKYRDICWGTATKGRLEDYFPTVEFKFFPDAVISLSPENYLFMHVRTPGAFCLGFFSNGKSDIQMGTLLGGILARNFLVTYDRRNNRVGFRKTQCDKLIQEWPRIRQTDAPAQSHDPKVPTTDSPWSTNHEVPAVQSPPPIPEEPEAPKPRAPTHPVVPAPTHAGSTLAPSQLPDMCDECVRKIVMGLQLSIPESSFRPLIPGFINDLAQKLSVTPAQIELVSADPGPKLDVVVLKLNVHPAEVKDGETRMAFFSKMDAKEIAGRILNHKIRLREVFGTYQIMSVEMDPPLREPAAKSSGFGERAKFVIAGALGAIVLSALVLGAVFVWRRRRSEPVGTRTWTGRSYETLQQTEDDSNAIL